MHEHTHPPDGATMSAFGNAARFFHACETAQAFLAVPTVDMIRFHAIQSERRV
jgi:hypothetical protein